MSVFFALWMNSSEPPEVILPRKAVEPMVRATSPAPPKMPPLVTVKVSEPTANASVAAVALFIVTELTDAPPEGTVCVPVKRRLLVEPEAANVAVCSTPLSGRMPTIGS